MFKGPIKYFWIAIVIYLVVTLPFLISNMLSVSWFGFAPGKADSWIGFWGSYLGSIVGMIAIFVTTQITIKNSEEQAKKIFESESKAEAFWRMLEMLDKHQKNNDTQLQKRLNQMEERICKEKIKVLLENVQIKNCFLTKVQEHQEQQIKNVVEYLIKYENCVDKVFQDTDNRNIENILNHLKQSPGFSELLKGTPYEEVYEKLVSEGEYRAEIIEEFHVDLVYNYRDVPFVKKKLKETEKQVAVKSKIKEVCKQEWEVMSEEILFQQRLDILRYLKIYAETETTHFEELILCFNSYQSQVSQKILDLNGRMTAGCSG